MKLKKNDGVSKPVNSSTYQSMVGSLLHAAMATRPDIAQAVSVVSKFNANPSAANLTVVKRILRYLKGTLNLALKYERSDSGSLIGYSDADWAGEPGRSSLDNWQCVLTGWRSSELAQQETVNCCSFDSGS